MSEIIRPTIPAEVADLIENMRKVGCTNEEIARVAMGNTIIPLYPEVLSQIPFDTLLAALVNGYEREMTKEEQAYANIRVKYLDARHDIESYANTLAAVRMSAFADGILFVLNEIGVKIEGVNA